MKNKGQVIISTDEAINLHGRSRDFLLVYHETLQHSFKESDGFKQFVPSPFMLQCFMNTVLFSCIHI